MTTGEIVAGPHVRNACRRHLDDLESAASRGLKWDVEAAARAIGFFEDVLRLKEGLFEGKKFKLAPSQAFIVGSLFGWKRWTEREVAADDGDEPETISGWYRRFSRAYIEQGKGNGKSPLAGGIGLYGLVADGESGAQIYSAGATRDQASILFADAVAMVRASGHLADRLRLSGGPGREHNIAHLASGSFFRAVSRETKKTGSGPRPHFALVDEIHEHPDRGVIDILERGFKFRIQPLLVMMTNSGSDRKSVCREEHEHAVRVAAGTRTPGTDFAYVGEPIDDETFSYVCALDPDDDPFEDPACWIKANPLLGVTITAEYLAKQVAQARNLPGRRNSILRLHFCVWTEAEEGWITGEALRAVLASFAPAEHAGGPIYCGLDLSGTKDLTVVAHVVPTGTVEREAPEGGVRLLPTYDAWIEAWTPREGLKERADADDAPYDLWVGQEHLRTTPGRTVQYSFIAKHMADVDRDYDIELLAYDRYAYDKFEAELDELGLELPVASHPQAGRKRAEPSADQVAAAKEAGEEKPKGLWMPGSLATLEELIFDRRIRLLNNPVLVSACMAAVIESDPLDNRWFAKRKATQRIDAVVALAMAVGAATFASVEDTSIDAWVRSFGA